MSGGLRAASRLTNKPVTYHLRHFIVPLDRGIFRKVLFLALPVIVGNLSRVLMNVVDVAMVGRLGVNALAAVGLGGVLIWTIFSVGVAFRTGVQTITARRHGEKRWADCGQALNNGLIFAVVVGAVVSVIGYLAAERVIGFLIHDPAVIPLAVIYTEWSFIGAACITVGYAFQGFFNGVEQTKVHMEVTMASNLLNVYLNAGLIFGSENLASMLARTPLGDLSALALLWSPFNFPALGVEGAAIATLIASVWMIVHYAVRGAARQFRTKYRTYHGGIKRETLEKIIDIATPQGLQEVGVTIVYILFFKIIAMIGTLEVAATEVVFTIMTASFMPGIGFGVACATLVGKHLGEKDPHRAAVSMAESVRWSVIFMGGMGILFMAFPRTILPFFTNDVEVIRMGVAALRLLGVIQFFDAVGMTLWFALTGAGNTKFPAIMDLTLAWGVFLPLSYLSAVELQMGIMGPWISFGIYITLYASVIAWKVLKGDWKKIIV